VERSTRKDPDASSPLLFAPHPSADVSSRPTRLLSTYTAETERRNSKARFALPFPQALVSARTPRNRTPVEAAAARTFLWLLSSVLSLRVPPPLRLSSFFIRSVRVQLNEFFAGIDVEKFSLLSISTLLSLLFSLSYLSLFSLSLSHSRTRL
jgi:hypothetical protein